MSITTKQKHTAHTQHTQRRRGEGNGRERRMNTTKDMSVSDSGRIAPPSTVGRDGGRRRMRRNSADNTMHPPDARISLSLISLPFLPRSHPPWCLYCVWFGLVCVFVVSSCVSCCCVLSLFSLASLFPHMHAVPCRERRTKNNQPNNRTHTDNTTRRGDTQYTTTRRGEAQRNRQVRGWRGGSKLRNVFSFFFFS